MLLDVPSVRPTLGFERVADGLGEIILQSEPRFAVGIFGGWGTGKTTLMGAIEERLGRHNVVCVRFVAWRYEKEEHLIIPLLDSIREGLVLWAEAHHDDAEARRTASTISRVMKSIMAGITVKIGVPGAIDLSFDANRALVEHARQNEPARDTPDANVPRSFYHASFRALESAFRDFVSAGADRRIAVFVDDLDRCLPDNALQVLESMKLFFDLDGFVFIVGLDEDIIEYAVESKYRVTGLNGTAPPAGIVQRVSGREYIKKIFQLPYRMAPVSMSELGEFLRGAFEEANFSDEQREDLRFVVEPHLRYLVRDGTVNPREVKRYINLYTLQAHVYAALDSVAKNVVLALQTLSFRADWETVWNPLLEFREEYVDALRRHLAIGDSSSELEDEFGVIPDDFRDYVSAGAAGNALLSVQDLSRYLSLGEAVRSKSRPALLEALGVFGELRRLLQVAQRSQATTGLSEELGRKLAIVESRLVSVADDSAHSKATLAAFHAFQRLVRETLSGDYSEADLSPEAVSDLLRPLTQSAMVVSDQLRRLYRVGDSGQGLPRDAIANAPVVSSESELWSRDAGDQRETTLPLQARHIRDVDPYELGVAREAAGHEAYLPRDIDAELRAGLEAAVEMGQPRLVALVGPPGVGKSRTLYEAVRATVPDAVLLIPQDFDMVAALFDPGALRRLPAGPLILWLDELERFVGLGARAFSTDVLTALAALPRRVTTVTTSRDAQTAAAGARLRDPLGSLLRHHSALVVRVPRELSASESVAVRALLPTEASDSLIRQGVGAYFVAGPDLARALSSGRHRPDTPECPEGAAVVWAAIDWRLSGMIRPIPEDVLRNVWPNYLADTDPAAEKFARGLKWALQPLYGTVALLSQQEAGYAAFDWLVAHEAELGHHIEPTTWDVVLEVAEPDESLAVGVTAMDRRAPERAMRAFGKAERSSRREVAGSAATQLGRLFAARGALDEAEAAFRRGETRGDADAAVLLGGLLEQLGQTEAAEAEYRSADDRGHPVAADRLARLLEEHGDDYGARAATRRAGERGAPEALVRDAVELDELGSSKAAIDIYRELIARYDGESEHVAQQPIADAFVNMAAILARLGRPEEALVTYERFISRFADATEPVVREQVARATVNMAAVLADMDRPEEALVIYERFIDGYADATEPMMREQIAEVLMNMADTYWRLGRSEDAESAFSRIIDLFADAAEPALRDRVTAALTDLSKVTARLPYEPRLTTLGDRPIAG